MDERLLIYEGNIILGNTSTIVEKDFIWSLEGNILGNKLTIVVRDFTGAWRVGWLFGFYGISTFVGYLMPNSFLYK